MTNPVQHTTTTLSDQVTIGPVNRSLSISGRTVLHIIISVAVLLRLLSAIYQGNSVADLPGIYDQISYDGLARRVLNGYGFSFAEGHWPATRAGEPTAHWSYLYTLYLVSVYKLFGTYPLIARVIQALLAGILQTVLIWRIGTRLFNQAAGMLAAMLNALYVYYFYYAGALITETFYITAILWTFDSALRIVHTARNAMREGKGISTWQWLELGGALGIAVLLRQVFLLFLPFLFLWLYWNTHDRKGANRWKPAFHWPILKGLSMSSLVMLLMICPFTIRNYRAFGTFVLLNTNAGFAFFWSNHPVHGTNFMPLISGGAQQYHDLIPKELLPLNEAQLDNALLQAGIQFIRDDPTRYLLLSVSRTKEFFKFWPTADSELISNISRVGSFGLILPFALYGLFIGITQMRSSRMTDRKWDIALLLIFALVYTLIHLLSWTLIRYRLPVDAVLIIFAALGMSALAAKIPFLQEKRLDHV